MSIKFPTGRVYDFPQELEISVAPYVINADGIAFTTATFTDASRHINGLVALLVIEGDHDVNIARAVFAAYDTHQYQSF